MIADVLQGRGQTFGAGALLLCSCVTFDAHTLGLALCLNSPAVLMALVWGINGINSLAQGLLLWVRRCQKACGANFHSTTAVQGIMSASARQILNPDLEVLASWQIYSPLWVGCFYSPLLCSLWAHACRRKERKERDLPPWANRSTKAIQCATQKRLLF